MSCAGLTPSYFFQTPQFVCGFRPSGISKPQHPPRLCFASDPPPCHHQPTTHTATSGRPPGFGAPRLARPAISIRSHTRLTSRGGGMCPTPAAALEATRQSVVIGGANLKLEIRGGAPPGRIYRDMINMVMVKNPVPMCIRSFLFRCVKQRRHICLTPIDAALIDHPLKRSKTVQISPRWQWRIRYVLKYLPENGYCSKSYIVEICSTHNFHYI